MENNKKIGDTIPLYDEVKRTIYISFNEMTYAYAELMTSHNRNDHKLSLWDFKKRFAKFFIQINHDNKLKKLDKKKQEYLLESYKNLKFLKESHATKIVNYSRELIELLGITKIEGKVKDNWAF